MHGRNESVILNMDDLKDLPLDMPSSPSSSSSKRASLVSIPEDQVLDLTPHRTQKKSHKTINVPHQRQLSFTIPLPIDIGPISPSSFVPSSPFKMEHFPQIPFSLLILPKTLPLLLLFGFALLFLVPVSEAEPTAVGLGHGQAVPQFIRAAAINKPDTAIMDAMHLAAIESEKEDVGLLREIEMMDIELKGQ